MRNRFWIVVLFVLALRLPYLGQAVQGDDVYYLIGAQHALVDPWHPSHARFLFQGDEVDLRGHPHPPLNSWILAALLALAGDVREPLFHAVYLLFSLLALAGMWSLAGRFAPQRRLEATLLFCAAPAFVVNGNSLEADIPFLAFWSAGAALFVARRLASSVLCLTLAALTAYQAVAIVPILWVFVWLNRRDDRASWIVALTPLLAVAGYQLYELLATGQWPAEALAGHFRNYNLQSPQMKLKNAAALAGHLAVMLSPLGLGGLLLAARRRREPFLLAWVGLFLAAALVLFFAGSARYLLPLAAPFALLVALEFGARPRLIYACLALQLLVGVPLAWVNYEQWGGYRDFVAALGENEGGGRRWVNAEHGLRFYAESAGALAVARGQSLRPGDWLIENDLGAGVPYTTGGGQKALIKESAVAPRLPLRLIGVGTGSAYSSVAYGLWPFGWSREPADRVRLFRIVERKPELSWLPMHAPQAESQIVNGIYALENNQWRWMSGRASILLKPPQKPSPLVVEMYLPEAAPGRTVRLELDGSLVLERTLAGPGKHTLESAPVSGERLMVSIDRDFASPGDNRRLGCILTAAGFRP